MALRVGLAAASVLGVLGVWRAGRRREQQKLRRWQGNANHRRWLREQGEAQDAAAVPGEPGGPPAP